MISKAKYFIVGIILSTFLQLIMFSASAQPTVTPALRLAVAGITHGHVPWILGRKGKTDVELVGIFETDTALSRRYAKTYQLDEQLFYADLKKMLEVVKPQAVVAFGSIRQHLAVVEACAPRGIHVMVEKPLATSNGEVEKMVKLAKDHRIHLLTNFETSWYPTTEKTYQLVRDSNFVGTMRKVVFHHGHEGPKKIGVNQEFFEWLTDPVENGGGALIDFGCYGANIMSYLMQDEEPLTVTAVTKHFQPGVYPKVDDEATIIVTYPSAQCIIQASWNWPFSRKDMEVYGENGYIITKDQNAIRMRNAGMKAEEHVNFTTREVPVYTDPFAYFADVISGRAEVPKNGLYSLENNVKVVRILDAARLSARTGKTIVLGK